jgi:uncharacterized delta-60 repeat protein
MNPQAPAAAREPAWPASVRRRLGAAAAVALLLAALRAAPACAADLPAYGFDPSFAGSGRVAIDLGGDEAADAVTLDAAGRILVAGTARTATHGALVLTALAPDGSIDTSFAEAGTVWLETDVVVHVTALAAVADGSAVAVSSTAPGARSMLFRVSADGVADERFAANAARALVDARVLAVAGSPDGGVLAAGVRLGDGSASAVVLRLRPDGTRDASFGDDGRVVLAAAGRDAAALAVALVADGGVVVAGRGARGGFVARLARDGRPEHGFADDGLAQVELVDAGPVVAAALATDGRAVLLASGARAEGPSVLVRTRSDGAIDTAFADAATRALASADRALRARSVAPADTRGRVVLVATSAAATAEARAASGEHVVLVRVLADGALDGEFGSAGLVDLALAGVDLGAAVAVQPDGRVVAGGSLGAAGARDLLVVRFAGREPRCGDGNLSSGEQCDEGSANGGVGSCCGSDCALRAAGIPCRPAAGACDEAELCDGTGARCPVDALARAGAPCRAAAGACDVAETCTGVRADCPANDVRARGTLCRVASGGCDLDEECDGQSGECPLDRKRSGECRASRGGCDPAEWCDGASGDCPPDERLPDGAACDDGDACTADDACFADTCRGGVRDDFACTGYLCSTLRGKRRVARGALPDADLQQQLARDLVMEGATAVCRPAVTAEHVAGAPTPQVEDDASTAIDAGDERTDYVVYKARPVAPVRQRDTGRRVLATVEDRFGALEVPLLQVGQVSLPAALGDDPAITSPEGGAYQCRGIAPAGAVTAAAREVAVRVVGEPGARSFALGAPRRVCRRIDPLAELDGDETSAGERLVCYDARGVAGKADASETSAPLFAVNAFESLRLGGLGKSVLCVPATLVRAAWIDPSPADAPPRRSPGAQRPPRARQPDAPPRPHRRERPPRPHPAPAEP